MGMRHWRDLFEAQWEAGKFVCVGLDSEYEQLPEVVKRRGGFGPHEGDEHEAVCYFNEQIVRWTADSASAFKPNLAFYLAHGEKGLTALRHTVEGIHQISPDVPVILDAKEADIDSTNIGYVKAAFEWCRVDGITLHPYLGAEALESFLAHEEKLCLILARTSNKGAGEFQDLMVTDDDGEVLPLYLCVAKHVARRWNKRGNCGVVAGATYPEELARIREVVGDIPILIPGIGKQGGDLEKAVRYGMNSQRRGFIVNSSRGIIFASKGEDFAEAAGREAEKLGIGIQAAFAE